jgi:hypothetical protein
MKRKSALRAIPEIFSVLPHGGYGRFIVKEGAIEMMRVNWTEIGSRLSNSIEKVTRHPANGRLHGQKAKETR